MRVRVGKAVGREVAVAGTRVAEGRGVLEGAVTAPARAVGEAVEAAEAAPFVGVPDPACGAGVNATDVASPVGVGAGGGVAIATGVTTAGRLAVGLVAATGVRMVMLVATLRPPEIRSPSTCACAPTAGAPTIRVFRSTCMATPPTVHRFALISSIAPSTAKPTVVNVGTAITGAFCAARAKISRPPTASKSTAKSVAARTAGPAGRTQPSKRPVQEDPARVGAGAFRLSPGTPVEDAGGILAPAATMGRTPTLSSASSPAVLPA